MSMKGYPTAWRAERALQAQPAIPRPSGDIGRIARDLGRIIGEIPRPANDNRAPGIPANDNERRTDNFGRRLPIPYLDALKLGWKLGDLLWEWIYGRQKDKNQTGYGECPAAYTLPARCVNGLCCGACGLACACSQNLASCPNDPPIVGFDTVIQQWHGLSAGGFVYLGHWWQFSGARWSGVRVDIPRQIPEKPWRRPEENPEARPDPVPPWENPWEQPVIPVPREWPQPPYPIIPKLDPNAPWRRTGPRPGENPWRDPRRAPLPRARPWRRPDPRRPSETPGIEVDPTPRGRPRIDPVVVRRKPPPARVREKKVPINSAGRRVLIRVIDGITEGKDFIEALEKSLPKDCQTGRNSPLQDKIAALFECSDQIDFCKAVEELVKNQVEDAIFGRAGSKLGKPTGRRMGRPVGPQAGPIDSPGGVPSKVRSSKDLAEYWKQLKPDEVAGDIARAVLDELGACD